MKKSLKPYSRLKLKFSKSAKELKYELTGFVKKTSDTNQINLDQSAWTGEIGSTWDYFLWPQLVVRAGQTWRIDDEDVHKIDEKYDWGEFIANWEYNAFTTRYNYFYGVREDTPNHLETTTEKHFGALEYSDQFWDNRINVDFSQMVDILNTDYNRLEGADGPATGGGLGPRLRFE